MALQYQASPVLHDFEKMKTPARLMQLLCDMPSGPHNAEKERLLRELATAIDYHREDARRQHYLKEAANFMIKRTHPGDLVMDSVDSQVRMPKEESPTEAHSMEAAAVPEVGPNIQGSDPNLNTPTTLLTSSLRTSMTTPRTHVKPFCPFILDS